MAPYSQFLDANPKSSLSSTNSYRVSQSPYDGCALVNSEVSLARTPRKTKSRSRPITLCFTRSRAATRRTTSGQNTITLKTLLIHQISSGVYTKSIITPVLRSLCVGLDLGHSPAPRATPRPGLEILDGCYHTASKQNLIMILQSQEEKYSS